MIPRNLKTKTRFQNNYCECIWRTSLFQWSPKNFMVWNMLYYWKLHIFYSGGNFTELDVATSWGQLFSLLKFYVCVCMLWLFETTWTVVYQAPLSMGFSRQEYWSGLPFPSPGDLPDPGIEPMSLTCPALAGGFFTTEPPGRPLWRWKNNESKTSFLKYEICSF